MYNSELCHKLKYFPQDADIHYSDYGLFVALMDHVHYEDFGDGSGPQLVTVSYELPMLTDDDLENLPWIKDPNWLEEHKRENYEIQKN